MIDLIRRNFIKNIGFAGTTTLLCGSAVFAQDTFGSFLDSGNKEETILSKFSKSASSDLFLFDSALLECYNKATVSWKKTGYEAAGDFHYSSSDNQLKMFPIHLHVNGSKKLDDVLLCFGKNQNGEWKALKPLSGFDLEALTVAMKKLKSLNGTIDLTNYLFPAPIQQFNPYGFETKRGQVFLKTQLSHHQTATKIVVTEGSTIIFQKEIISQHRLNVSSVLV